MITHRAYKTAGLMLCALIYQAFADTTTPVDLSGVVLDANGSGLAGVTIAINDMGLSATTDAQGAWSLSNGDPASIKNAATEANSSMVIYGQYLQMNLAQSGPVQVDIIDLMGRQAKTILKEFVPLGQYNVNLGAASFPKGVWLVRVQAAKEMHVFRWVNFDGVGQGVKLASVVPSHRPILAKSAGDPDTISITYNAHLVASIPQSNLVAGVLSDFTICTVNPKVSPSSAGKVIDSLPLYVLYGDSFTVHYSFDPSLWSPLQVKVGSSVIPAGDSVYTLALTAPTDSVVLSLATRAQTITLTNIVNQSFFVGSIVIGASASSGLPVALSTTTDSVCYPGNGDSILMVGVGLCSIAAIQSGSNQFNPVEKDTSFTISKSTPTVSFDSILDQTYGHTTSILLNATSSVGLPVSYNIYTPTICSINGYLLSLDSAGTCKVSAYTLGTGPLYNFASTIHTFQINPATQTIAFDVISGQTYGNSAFTLNAIAYANSGASGMLIGMNSLTPTICTYAGSQVTIKSSGNCIISAIASGNGDYLSDTAMDTIPIGKATQQVTLNPISDTTFFTTAFTPSASATSGQPVKFTSLTPTICSASLSSSVTLLASGLCTLVANQAGDTNNYPASSTPVSFNIAQANQTVAFTALGDQTFGATFNVSASASTGLPVVITSSNTGICTVSGTTVTLVDNLDSCRLVATQAGNSQYNSAQGFLNICIKGAAQTITFTAPTSTTYSTATFDLAPTASSGLPVTLASTTTSVCTVSGFTVTPLSSGTCTLQATQTGNENYLSATLVSKSITVNKATQTIAFASMDSVTWGSGATFTISASSNINGYAVTYSSTTTGVCTVGASTGTVTTVTPGICTITASQAGDGMYASAANSVTFTIQKIPQSIVFVPLAEQTYTATPFTIDGTNLYATSGLAVALTSATPSICAVSEFTVTMKGPGSCTINANQAGNADYAAAPMNSSTFTIDP